MTGHAPDEVCKVVTRRADLLCELRSRPREKRALVSTLAVSRSTIDRAVTELSELGLVSEADGRVKTTAAGDLAVAIFRDAMAGFEELLALGETLEELDNRLRPPPSFFGSTELVTAEDHPRAPAEHLIGSFLDADRCRLVRGTIRPTFAAAVRERMLDRSLTIDATLCAESMASLRSYHSTDLERVLDRENVTIREFPGTIDSGLYLFDTGGERQVALTIHDETTDGVRAFLCTERSEAVIWAEQVLAGIHDDATLVGNP